MIRKESFEEAHIRSVQEKNRRDPILIERVIYAFGLLEALAKVGLPFIFKGGTCLMLLLKEPRRLSTDIDIVVEPGTNIEEYIRLASEIFPFKEHEEDVRKGKNDMIKKHFKFTYDSPVTGKPFYILLDILFEKNHYHEVQEKEIQMDMLICGGEALKVKVPSIDCILGDKMTAFAPYTTGIPLRANKDMEVMKQMYDVASLIDEFTDFNNVCNTYQKICKAEIAYRGMDVSTKDCLVDTFMAAACVAGKAKINPEDYSVYVKAIRALHDHIFIENYSAEIVAARAPKIMYMAMCMVTGNHYEAVEDFKEFAGEQIQSEMLKPLKSLRKADPLAYAYVIKADELYRALTQKSVVLDLTADM